MPRQAKLRKKDGQWYTKSGSKSGTYFGAVERVEYGEAKRRFAAHLKTLSEKKKRHGDGLSVSELIRLFLAWVKAKRGGRTHDERKRHLTRFANFPVNGAKIGGLPATAIRIADLESFLGFIAKNDYTEISKSKWSWVPRDERCNLDPFTIGKYMTSIAACFAWGAGKGNPAPCLPVSFRPFDGFERHKRPPESLLESELPTKDEVLSILSHADDDVALVLDEKGRYRTRRAEEFRADHQYRGFRDMLKVYHQTGARTSELAEAVVSNYQKGQNQIILDSHKRSKTMKVSESRRIILTNESSAIVSRRCEGRGPTEPIFTDPKGRPWTRYTLGTRFQQVRKRAGVRKDITIYSFRHRWISDAMMNGIPVATVAKMAGTSIAMIERVYGHYTGEHFADAQKVMEKARGRDYSIETDVPAIGESSGAG